MADKEQLPALHALMKYSDYADRPRSKLVGERLRAWKRIYLRELAKHGRSGLAARMAGIDPTTAHRLRKSSGRFDRACRRATERAAAARREAIEREIYRRAMEGVEKPIFYNGVYIGSSRLYSDRLILRLAEKEMPRAWSPRRRLEKAAGPGPLQAPDAATQIADPRIAALACELARAMTERRDNPTPPHETAITVVEV